MAASIGRIIEILELAKVRELYNSTIREMQPVELVRRLESEKVSSKGEMYELRGRLLRLEILKMRPNLDVPWYPEDDVPEECLIETEKDQFYHNENTTTMVNTTEEASSARRSARNAFDLFDTLHDRVRKFEQTVSNYLALKEQEENMMQMTLSTDKQIIKSVGVLQHDAHQKDDESTNTLNEHVVLMDDETEEKMTEVSDGSSIVKISYNDEEFEKLDEDSMGSWDKESMWSRSSTTSVCRMSHQEIID